MCLLFGAQYFFAGCRPNLITLIFGSRFFDSSQSKSLCNVFRGLSKEKQNAKTQKPSSAAIFAQYGENEASAEDSYPTTSAVAECVTGERSVCDQIDWQESSEQRGQLCREKFSGENSETAVQASDRSYPTEGSQSPQWRSGPRTAGPLETKQCSHHTWTAGRCLTE